MADDLGFGPFRGVRCHSEQPRLVGHDLFDMAVRTIQSQAGDKAADRPLVFDLSQQSVLALGDTLCDVNFRRLGPLGASCDLLAIELRDEPVVTGELQDGFLHRSAEGLFDVIDLVEISPPNPLGNRPTGRQGKLLNV